MTQVAGWFYLLGLMFIAHRLASYLWANSNQRCSSGISILGVTLFLVLFMGCLLVSGVIGLLLDRPLFSIELALFVLVIVSFIIISLSRDARFKPAPSASLALDDRSSERIERSAVLLLVFSIVVLIALSLLLVVGFPRGFEVTAYHLPIAVNMFRDHSLAVWDRAFMHAYTANMEIWTGFWLTLLPERVVSVVNLPFLIFLMLGLYRLMRLTGSNRNSALILSLGIISIPVFGFSSIELGSDVAGVACLVAAIYLTLTNSSGDSRIIFIAGLAAGLAFGFKPLHLVGAGLLGLMLAVGLARHWKEVSESFVAIQIKQTILFVAGFLLMAAPWLLRNWWEFHNPLYPIHLGKLFSLLGFASAPDFSIFERAAMQFEWVRSKAEWFVYPWVEWQFISQNFKHSSGLGAFFAVAAPPAWVMWTLFIPLSLWRSCKWQDIRSLEPIWPSIQSYLLGTGILLVWAVLDDRQPRYAMGGIALLLVLYGPLLKWASDAWRRVAEGLLVASAVLMLIILIVSFSAKQLS